MKHVENARVIQKASMSEERVTWANLSGVYKNRTLAKKMSTLERSYKSTNQAPLFAKLVNTSLSKHQAYHRWVRYREGYAGELVKEILRRYPNLSKRHYVVDPMCGSGSTIVACCELGLNSIGLDVNPYATLATEVKSYVLSAGEISSLRKLSGKAIRRAQTLKPAFNQYEKEIAKYFDHEKLAGLVSLKREINKTERGKLHNVLYLALLSILEDCSNRKKDGNGLATRPSPVECVYLRYAKQLDIILADFCDCAHEHDFSCFALELDARFLKPTNVKPRKVGSIIFSPPYANSFDYFESYKLEIVFGEYSLLSKLNDFRSRLVRNYRVGIGAEVKSDIGLIEEICDEIWAQIPTKEKRTGIKDGRTRLVPNMLRSYFYDMREVISRCYDVLDKNGFMHIVVDQSAYVGIPVPTDTILAAIAEKVGFVVKEMIVCRGANTSGQQLKEYPYLKELLRETIVVLQK